jgi:2-polyprenyl-3-methyl-5-hydroxy-6-metoxy-1,4-benzoquinol methylase
MNTPGALSESIYSGNGMGQHYTNPEYVVVRHSIDLVTQTGAESVLDLACGRGLVSLAMCNETAVRDIIAMDINDTAVTELRQKAEVMGYPIDAWTHSATDDLPKDGLAGSRDLVVAKDLYPFLSPSGALKMLDNAAEALKPGGWLLLTAPSTRSRLYQESTPASVGNAYYRHIGPAARAYVQTDLENFTFTTVADLAAKLENAGLEPTEARHYGRSAGWIMMTAQKA